MELQFHIKNDSMPVIKAIGFVPDTLTEAKAVELGIVTRDTLLISVRDTLFPKNYSVDSLRYVPTSDGKEFDMNAGEIEKNQLPKQINVDTLDRFGHSNYMTHTSNGIRKIIHI